MHRFFRATLYNKNSSKNFNSNSTHVTSNMKLTPNSKFFQKTQLTQSKNPIQNLTKLTLNQKIHTISALSKEQTLPRRLKTLPNHSLLLCRASPNNPRRTTRTQSGGAETPAADPQNSLERTECNKEWKWWRWTREKKFMQGILVEWMFFFEEEE